MADEPVNIFHLEGVGRVYGDEVLVHALRDVDLRIDAGDFMSIVGPSGSGKSTLLGILGLLDQPTAGSVRLGGQDVSELDDTERSRLRGDAVGFVFQQFHLIPHLSALGNVATALLYRGYSRRKREQLATGALEQVGLGERAGHRPVQMSGGEQQRVALARAIVTEPQMVLADEPTGALDTENAQNVMAIFDGLRTAERAIVLVTHDLEIADLTERRVSMRDGRIVTDEYQDGSGR